MSTLKVNIVKVDEILKHPNADSLEIAVIGGWNCIVRIGDFFPNSKAVYIPIDAVLPETLHEKIFANTKVKPERRVKTIKLRGVVSQGILIPLEVATTLFYGRLDF